MNHQLENPVQGNFKGDLGDPFDPGDPFKGDTSFAGRYKPSWSCIITHYYSVGR